MYFPFLSLEWIILTWKKCGGRRELTEITFYLTFLEKGRRKCRWKDRGVSAKMFGKEIAEDSSRRERREKKSCFPSVFERGSRKLVYTGAFVCGGTITFPPTFFRFSSSLWILAGKGNFSAGTSTREAAFRATSYPVGAINEREGRMREEEADRERGK